MGIPELNSPATLAFLPESELLEGEDRKFSLPLLWGSCLAALALGDSDICLKVSADVTFRMLLPLSGGARLD